MIKILPIAIILTFILVAGCASQQVPHTVNFQFIDQNDKPLGHGLVNVTDPSSVHFQNFTDENGNVSFVLSESIEYNIVVTDLRNGQINRVILHPIETEYTVHFISLPVTQTPTQKIDPNTKLANDIQNLNNNVNTVANGITGGFQFLTKFI